MRSSATTTAPRESGCGFAPYALQEPPRLASSISPPCSVSLQSLSHVVIVRWSTNIYEVHKGGLYADSVVLKSGMIVTPTAVYPGDADPDQNATGPGGASPRATLSFEDSVVFI